MLIQVIGTELPDRAKDSLLYNIITRNNIHGPCGICDPSCVCMINGKCKKHFPTLFQNATDMSGKSYPKYRKRDNSAENHHVGNTTINNQWIVPNNPYLSKLFNAHINVEVCHTIAAIKYLCKYFTKGHDRAQVS